MIFSEKSRIGDLLKNESTKAILDKHFPGFTSNPRIGMTKGYTLKALAGFPQSPFTPEKLAACVEELQKIEDTEMDKIIAENAQKYKREGFSGNIRWGIIGLGNIAKMFALSIEGTEGSELYAVASRSLDRVKAFTEKFNVQKVYCSYEELVADPAVDVIYIANLKTQHYKSAKLALNAGKAVLVEKPFTINAKQAEELITIARQKNVFLMEAMWMRYNPNIIKLMEWINQGRIGQVKEIEADFSTEREPNPNLKVLEFGGGALIDMGIYPISFANMIIGRFPDTITSEGILAATGVDAKDSITFNWESGEKAELSCGFTGFGTMGAKVIGTDGYIEVYPGFHAAPGICIHNSQGVEEYSVPFRVNGYEYEVEEVMRCLDNGLKESPIMTLQETLETMKLMDSLRAQWGVVYPSEECIGGDL
jgi:dihydrodiol dehydrogenase / D-xylose 1-dehydrogenase (NADP)